MTRNIVPRANTEGTIGTIIKRWLGGFFKWLSIGEYIDLDGITNPSHQEGRIFYDDTEHTLSIYNENSEVTHNLGMEVLMRVYNDTGSDIEKGKVVYITGVNEETGQTPCLCIALAKADSEDTSHAYGFTTCFIPNGGYGYTTLCGQVHGLNTSSFSDGDILYLSDTVAGGITTVKPGIAILVGIVIKSDITEGIIFSKVNALGAVGADMLKSIYDTNDNGIVDNSENTQKIKGVDVETPDTNDDGKILVYDQATNTFILEKKGIYYSDYIEDEAESVTTDTINWQQKVRLIFTAENEKTGNYIIKWTAEIANSSANKGTQIRIEQDDAIELDFSVNAPIVAGGYATTGGFKRINIADTNPHTFDIDFKVESTGTAKIRRARIHISKVS